MSGIGESVAVLYVVRNPEEGTFGTVSVQFTVADSNGSVSTNDLSPSEGLVVLEDGVRFKVSFTVIIFLRRFFQTTHKPNQAKQTKPSIYIIIRDVSCLIFYILHCLPL